LKGFSKRFYKSIGKEGGGGVLETRDGEPPEDVQSQRGSGAHAPDGSCVNK